MIDDKEMCYIHQTEIEMLKEMDQICKNNNLRYSLAFGSILGAVRHEGFIPWDSDVDIWVDFDEYNVFVKCMKKGLSSKFKVFDSDSDNQYEYLFARIGLTGEPHHTIHIDIFPVGGAPKNRFLATKMWPFLRYLSSQMYAMKKVDSDVVYKNEREKRILSKIFKVILFFIPSSILKIVYKYLFSKYPIGLSKYLTNGHFAMKKEWYFETIKLPFETLKLNVPKDYDGFLRVVYGNDYMIPKKTNYYNKNMRYEVQ